MLTGFWKVYLILTNRSHWLILRITSLWRTLNSLIFFFSMIFISCLFPCLHPGSHYQMYLCPDTLSMVVVGPRYVTDTLDCELDISSMFFMFLRSHANYFVDYEVSLLMIFVVLSLQECHWLSYRAGMRSCLFSSYFYS